MIQFDRIEKGLQLPPFVQGVWTIQNKGEDATIQLVADGYPELVIPINSTIHSVFNETVFSTNTPFLIGQINTACEIKIAQNSFFYSLKLFPWSLGLFSYQQAKALTNKSIPLNEISGQFDAVFRRFYEQMEENKHSLMPLQYLLLELKNQLSTTETPLLIQDVLNKFSGVRQLTLQNIDVKTRFSRRYLEKQYAQHIGLSPNQYLKVLRVKKASILMTTNLETNIQSVAQALNYHDTSHLYKDFKGLTGLSPSAYLLKNNPLHDYESYLSQWDY